MATSRVLLTGFGPFPGAPENPSAWLAETLAAETPPAPDHEFHVRVFPTEWEAVAALTPGLYEALQPRVMIHFGLSQRAEGLRIERSAHNRLSLRADARGALPQSRVILADGPDRHDTALPASALAAHLRTRGHSAVTSRSAGRYLCNFLYYRSLDWTARQQSPSVVVFVHMPPGPSQGGPFSEQSLLRAAQETLRFVLAYAAQQAGERRPFASPLAAEADRSSIGREGGKQQNRNLLLNPLPDPSPQGGTEFAGAAAHFKPGGAE